MPSCSDSGAYTPARVEGVVWGTAYHITYNPADCRADVPAVVTHAIMGVDSTANAFNPNSELAQLNRTGSLAAPSWRMRQLVDMSRRAHSLSQGAFDPTVGPLVDAWGFGAGNAAESVSDSLVDAALRLVGLDKLSWRGDTLLLEPGMWLDLAAIAKGYGVDRVAQALAEAGIKDYMVEIGGEVRVAGTNPAGQPWRIQIDAPVPDVNGTHRQLTVLEFTDAAVATSGNYRNFRFDADGRLVSHTISPVTGRPAVNRLLSATVVAENCADADALATAAMVLGPDSAAVMVRRAIAEGVAIRAYLVTASSGENFAVDTVASK